MKKNTVLTVAFTVMLVLGGCSLQPTGAWQGTDLKDQGQSQQDTAPQDQIPGQQDQDTSQDSSGKEGATKDYGGYDTNTISTNVQNMYNTNRTMLNLLHDFAYEGGSKEEVQAQFQQLTNELDSYAQTMLSVDVTNAPKGFIVAQGYLKECADSYKQAASDLATALDQEDYQDPLDNYDTHLSEAAYAYYRWYGATEATIESLKQ